MQRSGLAEPCETGPLTGRTLSEGFTIQTSVIGVPAAAEPKARTGAWLAAGGLTALVGAGAVVVIVGGLGVAAVAGLSTLTIPRLATAATINVPADESTVRFAVLFANSGDDIVVSAGDYSGEGAVSWSAKDLTFTGAGAGLTTLPPLRPTSSEVEISDVSLPCLERAVEATGPDAITTLLNVEATGCVLSDQLIYVEGDLFLRDSSFTDMETEGGGIILAISGGHSINTVTFDNVISVAPPMCDPAVELCSQGAAATLLFSWTSVFGSTFSGCVADAGACIHYTGAAPFFPDLAKFNIAASTVTASTGQTSVLYAGDFVEFTINQGEVSGNVSPGGIVVAEPMQDNDALMALFDLRMENNQVAGSAAAAVVFKGVDFDLNTGETFTARHSWFCGNENIAGPADVLIEAIDNTVFDGAAFALGVGTASNEVRGSVGDYTNVTFAGYDGSAIHAINGAVPPSVTLNSTLFADLGGYAVESGGIIAASGSYLGMYDTAGWSDAVADAAFNASAVEQNPLFQGYVDRNTTTCADISLFLDAGSPMRDAADPTLDTDLNGYPDTDPDGTAIDIGAFGGRFSNLNDSDFDGVFEDLDCDDDDATTYPGAVEVAYDGIDQDCDGADLEDVDGDGEVADLVGGPDCDDSDAAIYTGAVEIWYDGIDQDCAGDDDFDQDGDGEQSDQHGGVDCDDTDDAVNTTASEIWYDDVDQDCDGGDDFDQDGDGFSSDMHGGIDCDDENADVGPGIEEIWYDGIDQDCDGNDDDQDGDGFAEAEDCDDLDNKINPDALDLIEDGTDQDCDGLDGPEANADTGTKTAGGGDNGGCGCATTADPAAGWWLVVLLAAIGTRRRSG